MKKILYTMLFVFALGIQLEAQEKYSIVGYSMGFGTGDTNEFIDQSSFSGFQLEFGQYVLEDKFSVGIQSGFQSFYKELPKTTYPLENGAVTGKQYRYLSAVPILANGMFYPFGQETKVIPHVGLGVGTYYIDKQLDMGLTSLYTTTWHFGLAPQLGASFPINYKTSINLNAQYNMAVKTSDNPAENWLSVSVGFRFIY
ncbi:outer membrane beta-barrel protein [Saccharicrinis aurantiacus]|uniref:outer membrane beta-barrel protein n=1 Tax=Saccharicrinis aurantiacus TaxID=1849719 RepID=UPI00094F9F35|nr:outer membrane beta-barrel protein [Saccharicrinis aurantiacus]